MGSRMNVYLATVLVGVVRMVFGLLTSQLLRTYGRRSLTMFSGLGMAVCMTTSGYYTQLIMTGRFLLPYPAGPTRRSTPWGFFLLQIPYNGGPGCEVFRFSDWSSESPRPREDSGITTLVKNGNWLQSKLSDFIFNFISLCIQLRIV